MEQMKTQHLWIEVRRRINTYHLPFLLMPQKIQNDIQLLIINLEEEEEEKEEEKGRKERRRKKEKESA